jgi:glucose-1-phosphate thymidylyltransferase
MIYYPLSVLMLAGIRDILLISTPHDLPLFRRLLGDGSQWGLRLEYAEQPSPAGLPQAFLIGEEFLKGGDVCLVLGDNLFFGEGLSRKLQAASSRKSGATMFGYYVNDPARYGVVQCGPDGKVVSLEEKPAHPKSNIAVTGLYFFDRTVTQIAKGLTPSARGELEIVDVLKAYLANKTLLLETLGRGTAWLDTGTHEAMNQAANFVEVVQNRQGLKIACLEEIAWRMGFITTAALIDLAGQLGASQYGKYLSDLALRGERDGT